MEKHIKFNYSKITSYIYLGTNSCCITHFNKEFLDKRISGDISLEDERIDNPKGASYFLWLSVWDKTSPTRKQLIVGIDTINNFLKQKIKFYLHCKNGHDRAPTLLAA